MTDAPRYYQAHITPAPSFGKNPKEGAGVYISIRLFIKLIGKLKRSLNFA
jgi:hypothetical protein